MQTKKVVRDIVFLVDGSSYVGDGNLPYVRDFMINTVNQLEIRPDRVQIGLLQFAEQPRIEFYLNSFRNRQAVVNKISQMRLLGGSVLNVGAAVTYALENMFQASTGSRKSEGAHQVLVIVTGAPGEDQLSTLGDTLALEKILTFTVTSGQANTDAWQRVAFIPDLAYHSEDFSKLPEVADTIIDQLTSVVGTVEGQCISVLTTLSLMTQLFELNKINVFSLFFKMLWFLKLALWEMKEMLHSSSMGRTAFEQIFLTFETLSLA